MKNVIMLVLCLVFILAVKICFAEEPRSVQPIDESKALGPLGKSFYNDIAKLDKTEQKIICSVYVSGFLDGVLSEKSHEINPKELSFVNNFLESCKGMTEGQLADMMLEYYEQNPQDRDQMPVVILAGVIPRLKKGLSPYLPLELRK
jgi:hypothetical protein